MIEQILRAFSWWITTVASLSSQVVAPASAVLLGVVIHQGGVLVDPPVFKINHPAGKPADDSPGGEPYNEINQIHLPSPFSVSSSTW